MSTMNFELEYASSTIAFVRREESPDGYKTAVEALASIQEHAG